jgi:hypothetical protein
MATPVNSLYARLLEAHSGKPEVVPKGWKTVIQYASEWGCHEQKANALVKAGLAKGIMEGPRKFRVKLNKVVRQTNHYREKSGS